MESDTLEAANNLYGLDISSKSLYITHSGHQFDIANICEDDIRLEDIAHGLTKICRYGQAMELDEHYSVCQHSLTLCCYAWNNLDRKDLALQLLMHDASEAYLGDIPKGLKSLLPDYMALEDKVSNIIFSKYNIPIPNYLDQLLIKELDTRILLDEASVFVPKHIDLFKETLKKFRPLQAATLSNEDLSYKKMIKNVFLETAKILGVKDE